MNISKEEHLSALLDDEAGAFEQRRLLDELRQDTALGETLSRYALVGEVMRANGRPALAKRDFLAGIHELMEDEEVYQDNVVQFSAPVAAAASVVPAERMSSAMPRPWAQYGMAAAVAAVAVAGTLYWQQPTQDSATLAANAVTQSQPKVIESQIPLVHVQTAANTAANDARTLERLDPQTRDILKQYVAQHVKYASTTAIVPSVRAVSYSNDY